MLSSVSGAAILDGLNPQQEEAVTTTEGPLLILAGAGSGKTTVLTKRIAWILESGLAQRSQILAVTFTNKAAREMTERIEGLCGEGYFPNVGTFHAVCARWLRREAKYLDVTSSFSIYDTESQIALMREILRDQNVDSEKFKPRDLLAQISRYKNKRLGPDDLSQLLKQERFLIPIYKAYNERLRANDSLDFDDILVYTVELFLKNPEVCEKYRSRLHYILVDEFQDVNPIQYELLRLILGEHHNFCAVGDDDQSIYGFRGADISIILRFEEDFPEAVVVKLERNYRSTQQILDVANAVVSNNSDRKDKKLWSDRVEGNNKPCLYVTRDQTCEARCVVQVCKALVNQCGYRYSDIAILYRANFQSRSFEEVLLREEGISYEIVGGRRFYDRKEVRDILAYLYVFNNPSDSVALGRIITNTPGIGEGTFNKIIDFSARSQVPIMHALALAEQAGIGKGIAGRCHKLYEWLVARSEYAQNFDCSLYDLANCVLEDTGYKERLLNSEQEEDKDRLDNINELLEILRTFDAHHHVTESSGGDPPLRAFLNEVSLISTQDELEEDENGSDRLVLMTIHTSKGLEFPVVFLVGLEDGLLPHHRSLDSEQNIEEERRLCYVGLTRAKDMLYITASASGRRYGQESELSRFVYEMPIECMDVKSDGHPRSETFIAELLSGKGFRGARSEVEEQLSEFVSRKGVVELVGRGALYNGAMSGGLGASSSSSGDSSREKPEIKFSSERRFRRKAIASKFPPGCTIKHSKYGLGEVRFIASNKLWVRFHSDPKQVLPVPSDEAELASPL